MTQLIIEDGTGVDLANSFADDAEFTAYANLRGLTVPATVSAREILLILAMDYLFNIELKFQGVRVPDGLLPWPRRGAYAFGVLVPSTGAGSIPSGIKNAQIELALQCVTDKLLINSTNQNVQQEKIGTLEVKYFSGGSWSEVMTGRANAYLKPYFINGGNNNRLVRI